MVFYFTLCIEPSLDRMTCSYSFGLPSKHFPQILLPHGYFRITPPEFKWDFRFPNPKFFYRNLHFTIFYKKKYRLNIGQIFVIAQNLWIYKDFLIKLILKKYIPSYKNKKKKIVHQTFISFLLGCFDNIYIALYWHWWSPLGHMTKFKKKKKVELVTIDFFVTKSCLKNF